MEPPPHRATRSAARGSRHAEARSGGVPVDGALLAGFSFECRPACGLCCFATPRVAGSEADGLLTLDPSLVLEADGDDRWIALRGAGGACGALRLDDRRCGVHAARPSPCRLYPIHVHLGDRAQASLILSCPGVTLPPVTFPGSPPGPTGLSEELRWVEAWRATPSAAAQLREAGRRLRRAAERADPSGAGPLELRARAELGRRPPRPVEEDFPLPDGPSEEDGLETLPIFQDPIHGTVALSDHGSTIDLLRLDASGGVRERLAEYPRTLRRPRVEADAWPRLDWYVAYLAGRDAIADAVRWEWIDGGCEGTLADALSEELRYDGALVLDRARLRALLEGRTGEGLTVADIEAGIRAVDAERLDRPFLGGSL